MTRLENWSVYSGALIGNVYGHPDFPSGTAIMVGFKRLDLEKQEAVTRNRVYALGIPAISTETICAKADMDSFLSGDEVA